MPALDNPKHERFAQGLAEGKTAKEAFEDAGYTYNRANCHRLQHRDDVRQRVDELMTTRAVMIQEVREKAIESAAVTLEGHLRELERLRDMAVSEKQYSAAIKAEENRGKVAGLYIERKEVRTGALDEMTVEQKRERAIGLAKQLGLHRMGPTAGTA